MFIAASCVTYPLLFTGRDIKATGALLAGDIGNTSVATLDIAGVAETNATGDAVYTLGCTSSLTVSDFKLTVSKGVG